MITAKKILRKIQEISMHYLSGTPPIDINGLTQELQASKEEVLPVLKELEKRKIISFYSSAADAIKLTVKGVRVIPRRA
jgi:DNA-binding MarR family transcriptional regulator